MQWGYPERKERHIGILQTYQYKIGRWQLVAVIERQLQKLLQEVIKEIEKKMNTFQFLEDRIYGCKQEEKPKLRTRN